MSQITIDRNIFNAWRNTLGSICIYCRWNQTENDWNFWQILRWWMNEKRKCKHIIKWLLEGNFIIPNGLHVSNSNRKMHLKKPIIFGGFKTIWNQKLLHWRKLNPFQHWNTYAKIFERCGFAVLLSIQCVSWHLLRCVNSFNSH